MQVRERHTKSTRGQRVWLMASEMDAKWGWSIAHQMRDRKENDPELQKTEVRDHPELPGVQARLLK